MTCVDGQSLPRLFDEPIARCGMRGMIHQQRGDGFGSSDELNRRISKEFCDDEDESVGCPAAGNDEWDECES